MLFTVESPLTATLIQRAVFVSAERPYWYIYSYLNLSTSSFFHPHFVIRVFPFAHPLSDLSFTDWTHWTCRGNTFFGIVTLKNSGLPSGEECELLSRTAAGSRAHCKQSTKFHHYFKTQFLLWILFIFDIPQSNQTPRRGNVTNYMAPPSPGARDAQSPSRSSPSCTSKSVPGYMQPTRSSGASKGSGTARTRKGSEKKRWCRRPFTRDYFLTIE